MFDLRRVLGSELFQLRCLWLGYRVRLAWFSVLSRQFDDLQTGCALLGLAPWQLLGSNLDLDRVLGLERSELGQILDQNPIASSACVSLGFVSTAELKLGMWNRQRSFVRHFE